jgi:sugar phosphate isomerase/epimerase
MHLQDIDMKSAPAASANGGPARHPQVALGEGSIDWVKTFKAAKTGGVKNYFVEQTWDLTQKSVAFLKTLNV